jgi:hypothetical protein
LLFLRLIIYFVNSAIDKAVIHFGISNENNKFTHSEVLVFVGSNLEKVLENPTCPFKKLN